MKFNNVISVSIELAANVCSKSEMMKWKRRRQRKSSISTSEWEKENATIVECNQKFDCIIIFTSFQCPKWIQSSAHCFQIKKISFRSFSTSENGRFFGSSIFVFFFFYSALQLDRPPIPAHSCSKRVEGMRMSEKNVSENCNTIWKWIE